MQQSKNVMATRMFGLVAAVVAMSAMACTPLPEDGSPASPPLFPGVVVPGSGQVDARKAPTAAVDAGPASGPTCGADGGAAVDGPSLRAVDAPGLTPRIPTVVTRQATPVPPLTGGTLLALSDGQTVVAADPERDQVYVVDLGSNTVRATVALQAGDEPGRLVEDSTGLVHVALRRGGAIVSLDPSKGTLGARRAVCLAPRGIAFDARGDLLHVACAGGELVSLPAAGGAATRTLMLERDLRDVALGPGDKLLVSTFRSAKVLVLNGDGSVAEQLHPGSGIVPPLMGRPRHMSPAVAWRMQPLGGAKAGSVIMLHQTGVDDVVDPGNGGYGGIRGCGAIASAGVSVLTPGSSVPPPVASGLQLVSLAIDIAVSPDGSKVALAVPGNAHTSGMPSIVEAPISTVTSAPGSGCTPVAPPPGSAPPAGEVISVTFTKNGLLLAQLREPAALWRADGATISLAMDSREDTGHLIFHANAGGGLACASCHPEGGEDGRVWNFACIGARRTQSIRGGISATAPFHWDGAERDFPRLVDDVFVTRMSGPRLSADQKQALERWVDTIPALPVTVGLDAAAVVRGKALFDDTKLACGSCHAGELLTNNATVDVGTGGLRQVPSLRGVSWRAPFMHDGCAATLADRFGRCGGGDLHGVTSQLSTDQIGDLVTFLQSL